MTLIFILGLLGLIALFFIMAKQLWLYFIAGMHLQKMRDAVPPLLTPEQEKLGYWLLFEGLALDYIFHVTWGSLIFLEWPAHKEYTLSARLWRLSNMPEGPDDWRRRLALKIRTKLLDTADKRGYHRG